MPLLVVVLALWWAPAWLLDLLLAANLLLSVAALVSAMRTLDPAASTQFPQIMLLASLGRVALNLSVTRLLWRDQGGASWLLPAFGHALTGGRVWLAVILCLLALTLQWLLIRAGVERVAQLNACYQLDAMPGRQMGLDADLHAGLIHSVTADLRRRDIEREADFYASVDGLGKLVGWESPLAAALLLANLLRGEVILCLGNSLLVSICASLSWLAVNLMVTRAAIRSNLGERLEAPSGRPRLLLAAAALIVALEVVRVCGAAGLPPAPFFVLTGAMHLGLSALRSQRRCLEQSLACWGDASGPLLVEMPTPEVAGLLKQLPALRRELAEELGFILPAVCVRFSSVGHRISFQGRELAAGRGQGVFEHLRYLARRDAAQLLDSRALLKQVDLRGLGAPEVDRVLRTLLDEGVSIRPLQQIVDCMAERPTESPELRAERVRVRLSRDGFKHSTRVLEVLVADRLDFEVLPRLRDGDILLTSQALRPQWRQTIQGRRVQVVTAAELTATAFALRRL